LERSRTFLRVEHSQRFDRIEILLKLLLRSTLAESVGFADTITAEILRRFFLMTPG
jgi:hypothetical protein